MPFVTKSFNVLIAYPRNAADEEAIIKQAFIDWNRKLADKQYATFIPHSWKTSTTPDPQLIEKCDYLITVFKGEIESQPIEEIEKYIDSGKPASIYVKSINPEQLNLLKKVKKKCQQKSIYHEIDKLENFKTKAESDINLILDKNTYFSDSKITNSEFLKVEF